MKRIFISYKRVDIGKVLKIKERIETGTSQECWMDIEGIESDAQFKNVIINAINNAEVVLFMYSHAHSKIVDFENDWTVRELNFAKAKKKRIVFINLDGSPLTDEFTFDFGTKQQVDASSEDHMTKLIADIRKWLNVTYLNIQGGEKSGEVNDENIRIIKCFIAGSSILEMEQNVLRAAIAQTNNKWRGKNIEIISVTYEDFGWIKNEEVHTSKCIKYIENAATLVIFIIKGEIGQYTINEFEHAMNAFKCGNHPKILIFNDINSPSRKYSEKLKEKVTANKQYWSNYKSLKDLKQQFIHTLDWILIEMFL